MSGGIQERIGPILQHLETGTSWHGLGQPTKYQEVELKEEKINL